MGPEALPDPTDESILAYPGWRVAIASSVGVMVGFGSILIYTFGIFLKPLNAEVGWTRETISTAFACASMTLGFCSPALGRLLDVYGPRRVILACVTIFGLAFGSLAFLTPNKIQLFATFVVIGMVGNGTAQMGYARAVSTWFNKRRGLALALMMAGSGGGAIVAPVLCQRLITHYGWRAAYAILGLTALAVGLPLAGFLIRERSTTKRSRIGLTYSGAGLTEAMKHRAFWILATTLFLAAMSTTGTVTHLAALLTDGGITVRGASFAVSAMGAASLLGRLATGWMLDRFFGARVGMVLLFITSAGMLLLASAHTEGPGILAAIMIGFSMGGESDVTPYLLARYFGLRSFSVLYGFTWTAYAISAAIGSILLGRAFDRTGSYHALLIELSLATLLAATLMALMPGYPADARMTESSDEPGIEPTVSRLAV